MTTSMLDQILFNLCCGHHAILGRLANKNLWTAKAAAKKRTSLSDLTKGGAGA
jgi:hypothetical protein